MTNTPREITHKPKGEKSIPKALETLSDIKDAPYIALALKKSCTARIAQKATI